MRVRALLAAACAVLACSGGDTARDGGIDAALDVSVDGGRDIGVDVGAPADARADAPTDMGTDAQLGPDPGWVRLPGFPDDCYVERATRPTAVLAYHWEACLDGLPACQMAVLDRSVAPLDRVVAVNGGNDLRGVLVWHLLSTDRSYVVFVHDDVVVAAWRDAGIVRDTACLADGVASASGMAMGASFLRPDGTGADMISVASWADLGTLDSPVSMWTITSTDFLETPSTSATTFAATLLSGRIFATEPPVTAILGRGDLNPVVVGHTVLWNWGDASGATGIHLSRIGATETELYRAPPGMETVGVRADGTWIVWRADTPGTSSSPFNELWAAPYAETPPLAARRLWTDLMTSGRNGVIGDGMFACDGWDPTARGYAMFVVDLSTGARRRYPLPFDTSAGGVAWGLATDPAWVTRDELVFPAGRTAGATRLQTVLRIDLRGVPVEPLPDADAGASPDAGADSGP